LLDAARWVLSIIVLSGLWSLIYINPSVHLGWRIRFRGQGNRLRRLHLWRLCLREVGIEL